ncbi:serine O-acetyltransferase [Rubritalea marina]|uniref:serine O-acetyltransferase n=1 Tax=Rubritalea marina TaxID=361055 RepID=UPI000377B921|nr:serine O-acetyltransferase [Rubritalea marina]
MSEKTSLIPLKLCQSTNVSTEEVWQQLRCAGSDLAEKEPQLSALVHDVLLDRESLGEALAARLARKLAREDMSREELMPLLVSIFTESDCLTVSASADMMAIKERDAACHSPLEPLLFFKGFLAMTTYRVAHHLWNAGRRPLALYFQSICSEVFSVDIHPAARIGHGILLDHATSIVIGETAIVEDNVSLLHEVTLGGTGKVSGDRHPVVRSGVLIGAGAKILGRVEIGHCAKVGAGSVVLSDVAPHVTVAGIPAKKMGKANRPAMDMNQCFESGLI